MSRIVEDRRAKRVDRRVKDIGPPPGCHERRKRAERRLPAVDEASLSHDEFEQYFGAAKAAGTVNKLGNADQEIDAASEVLDRVRDRF